MHWLRNLLFALEGLLLLINPSAGYSGSKIIYLPLISGNKSQQIIVNAPYFNNPDVITKLGAEMAVFWFGKVTMDTSYADVRVGFNDTELDFHVAAFDRRVWYDPNPASADMTQWDAVSIYIQTNNSDPLNPSSSSYKFISGYHFWEDDALYRKSFKGNGTSWIVQPMSFLTSATYRGDAPNNDSDDRGWTTDIKIPFSALGLSSRPADGTIWRLGVALYNRNGENIPPAPINYWPEGSNPNNPNLWGRLRFGLPSFQSPTVSNLQSTTIRQGLNGTTVTDAAVGGGTICGDGLDFFSQWGQANYANYTYVNVQNQFDVADWPCYSKVYINFPLSQIPPGKVIKSGHLILNQFGNADPSNAYSSLIQVMTVAQDWKEDTITWNNAPAALENVAQTWVDVIDTFHYPGDSYMWDVSRAVDQAYRNHNPLKLVIYSADSAYNSGKYFTSSDTDDGNTPSRPTLIIEWGD